MFSLEIQRIKNIIEDGVVARDVNREEQLNEAKNRQQRYEQNKGNGGNFFNSLATAYNSFQNMATTGIGYLANQANSMMGAQQPGQQGGIRSQVNNSNPYGQPSMFMQQPGGYPPQQFGYPGQPGWSQPLYPGQYPGQNPGQYPPPPYGYPQYPPPRGY